MFYAGTLSMGIIIRAEDLDSGEYNNNDDNNNLLLLLLLSNGILSV